MPKDEFDPEDPLELCGVGLASHEDTTLEMTDCFIEEYMRLGYNHKQILALFRNPNYTGLNMVLQNKGEPFVRERIQEIFTIWGRPFTWPLYERSAMDNETSQKTAEQTERTAPEVFERTLPVQTDPMGGEIPLELIQTSNETRKI